MLDLFFWSVISAEVRFLTYLKALWEGSGMQKALQTLVDVPMRYLCIHATKAVKSLLVIYFLLTMATRMTKATKKNMWATRATTDSSIL